MASLSLSPRLSSLFSIFGVLSVSSFPFSLSILCHLSFSSSLACFRSLSGSLSLYLRFSLTYHFLSMDSSSSFLPSPSLSPLLSRLLEIDSSYLMVPSPSSSIHLRRHVRKTPPCFCTHPLCDMLKRERQRRTDGGRERQGNEASVPRFLLCHRQASTRVGR